MAIGIFRRTEEANSEGFRNYISNKTKDELTAFSLVLAVIFFSYFIIHVFLQTYDYSFLFPTLYISFSILCFLSAWLNNKSLIPLKYIHLHVVFLFGMSLFIPVCQIILNGGILYWGQIIAIILMMGVFVLKRTLLAAILTSILAFSWFFIIGSSLSDIIDYGFFITLVCLVSYIVNYLRLKSMFHSYRLQLEDAEQKIQLDNIVSSSTRNRERYQKLIETVFDGIIETQGIRIIRANRSVSEIFGYAPEELINIDVRDLFLRRHDCFESQDFSLREYKERCDLFETKGVRKDGSTILLQVSVNRSEYNAPGKKICGIKDITKQRRAEKALEESERNFRQLTETIHEVFFLTSGDMSEIIYISPAFKKMWGIPRESLYKNPDRFLSSIHPSDRERVKSGRDLAIRDDQVYDEEYRIILPDSKMRWIHSSSYPIYDKEGRVYRRAGISEDITERKMAEIELRLAREYEFEIGARIQRQLLLDTPKTTVSGLDLSAETLPSQMVDGDFYNFFTVGPHSMDFLVGDVMGKGISAALLGAAAKSIFLDARLQQGCYEGEDDRKDVPERIVNTAHGLMVNDLKEIESFLTLNFVRLNTAYSRLDFIDCGNTPLIHYRKRTNSCWLRKGNNMPFGFSSEEYYKQYTVPFEEGDLLCFYSDGMSDARNEEGESFNEERIVHLVQGSSEEDAESLVKRLIYTLFSFVGGRGFQDDVTAVVVRRYAEDRINSESSGEKMSEVDTKISNNTISTRAERRFTGQLSELEALRSFIKSFLPDMAEEEAEQTILAGHEAFTNIILHAFGEKGEENSNETVEVEVENLQTWFYIRFLYTGESFDWKELKDEDYMLENDGRGYGLYIMNQVMDSVSYAYDNKGRNEVCLVKFLNCPEASAFDQVNPNE